MARGNSLLAGLQSIFPTDAPEQAARTRTGAILTSGNREPAETSETNWLPLVAVGLAVAVLALAVVQNPAKSRAGQLLNLPSWQDEEPNSESDLQTAQAPW